MNPGPASPASPAYPTPSRRQRTAERWAPVLVLAGGACFVAALFLVGSPPFTSGLLGWAIVAVGLVGFGLAVAGMFLTVGTSIGRLRERIRVGRAVTAPEQPAPLRPATEAEGVRGAIVLREDYRQRLRLGFFAIIALATLFAAGAIAAGVGLLFGRFGPPPASLYLVLLLAALPPLFLLMADTRRGSVGFLAGGPARALFFTSQGVEGALYPFSEYQPEPDGYTLRTRWFHVVLARLPAPNQIPWRLVSIVAARVHDDRDPNVALVALLPAAVPWWMGGLKIVEGFWPSGMSGDSRLAVGLVVAVPRSQLDSFLWMAFRGGSRLFAENSQLTPAGRAAAREYVGKWTSFGSRPLNNAPWYVSLPPPSSREELAGWVL